MTLPKYITPKVYQHLHNISDWVFTKWAGTDKLKKLRGGGGMLVSDANLNYEKINYKQKILNL